MKGSDPAKAHGSLELRIGLKRPMGPMGLMRNRSQRTAIEGAPPICYLLFAICYLSSQHSCAAIYALVYENERRRERFRSAG